MRASLAPPGVRAVYGACAGRLKTAPSHVGEAATDAAVAAKNPWGGRGGGELKGPGGRCSDRCRSSGRRCGTRNKKLRRYSSCPPPIATVYVRPQ